MTYDQLIKEIFMRTSLHIGVFIMTYDQLIKEIYMRTSLWNYRYYHEGSLFKFLVQYAQL